MRIPFTVPQLPELKALPQEERARVLRRYAGSPEARRHVRCVQVSMLVAIVLFCAAITFHGAVMAVCCVAAVLSLIGGVAYYRMAATQAICVILHSTNSNP